MENIFGLGVDSIDGTYSVEGNWKTVPNEDGKYILLWEEKYKHFSVTVVGKMTNSIRGAKF